MAYVTWSDRALGHLDAIADYITRSSPRMAQVFVRRVMDATERLKDFPLSGRLVPELARDDVREILLGRYRIIYQVTDAEVEIAAVWHGARRLRRSDIENGDRRQE